MIGSVESIRIAVIGDARSGGSLDHRTGRVRLGIYMPRAEDRAINPPYSSARKRTSQPNSREAQTVSIGRPWPSRLPIRWRLVDN